MDSDKCNAEWSSTAACRWVEENSPLSKIHPAGTCANIIETCLSLKDKDKCLGANFPYFPFCSWIDEKNHPYYKSQCIPVWNKVNIGTQCLGGTGCYAGCGGNGGLFRSIASGVMSDSTQIELGAYNEKLFCDVIKAETGSAGGKCIQLFELFK